LGFKRKKGRRAEGAEKVVLSKKGAERARAELRVGWRGLAYRDRSRLHLQWCLLEPIKCHRSEGGRTSG
jgi:hypothetical protein